MNHDLITRQHQIKKQTFYLTPGIVNSAVTQPFPVSDPALFAAVATEDTLDEFVWNPVGIFGTPDIEFTGFKSNNQATYEAYMEVSGIGSGNIRKVAEGEIIHYSPAPIQPATNPIVQGKAYSRNAADGDFTLNHLLPFPGEGNALNIGDRLVPRFSINAAGGNVNLLIGRIIIYKFSK